MLSETRARDLQSTLIFAIDDLIKHTTQEHRDARKSVDKAWIKYEDKRGKCTKDVKGKAKVA
jgi:hypothetical protein